MKPNTSAALSPCDVSFQGACGLSKKIAMLFSGVTIAAHQDFRFVTTMNEDASTYEIPEYIHSRLMPQIHIDFPDEDEERKILELQVPGIEEEVRDHVLGFLRAAHLADLPYSVRDGINVARYAMKLIRRTEAADSTDAVNTALRMGLGEEEAQPFFIPG